MDLICAYNEDGEDLPLDTNSDNMNVKSTDMSNKRMREFEDVQEIPCCSKLSEKSSENALCIGTENVSQSKECDFFGLNNSDSDSSREEETAVEQEPPHSKQRSKHKLSVDYTLSEAKFWRGEDERINWNDSETLWNCETTPSKNVHTNSTSGVNNEGTTNHRHPSDELKDVDAERGINQRLNKSCFVVHHKLAPHLHSDTPVNKPPRKQSCELSAHKGAVNRVQWCARNYSHLLLTASMDRTVKIWNVFSAVNSCVQILRHHDKAVKDAKWSPSGFHILSCSYDKTSCITDVETGCCLNRFSDDGFVTCVTYHPVNSNVFVSGANNSMKAWDVRTGTKPVKTFSYKDSIGQVQDVVFKADGTEMFSCNDLVTRDSADRNIMAWDFNKSVVLSNQIYQERYTCCRLSVHPDQLTFMAQTQGNYIAQFSTIRPYKMNKCKRYDGHKVFSYSVGFDISPDGCSIISGSSTGDIPIYDVRSTRVLRRLSIGQQQVVLDVSWHPVLSSTVAAVTWDGNMYIWS